LVSMMLHAAEHNELVGPMNGVGPNPVTNREFTQTLAKTLHRPAILPAPYFGLRLAFGEFAEVLFQSQRCVPRAAERTGFHCQYPNLDGALKAILC
jgi:NAD dependent epimerase/dehydratase family enzyme